MKVIGLTGYAGSGKDTVAALLLKQHEGYRRAFADPLREGAAAIFGLTQDQMLSRDLKEREVPVWGKSPREILQLLGTECVREVFGPDTWVKAADLRLEALVADDTREPFSAELVVFTDVRFAEEADFIRSKGGVVVRVLRPGCLPVNAHVSDQGLPNEYVDFELFNDGDFEQLNKDVKWNCDQWIAEARDMFEAAKDKRAA